MKKIFIIYILVMLLANISHAVTPHMIADKGFPEYSSGFMFAAMSFTMFLFAPLWGVLSDRHGRKKIIVFGAIGYGVSQIWFGMADTLVSTLGARMLTGVFAPSFVAVAVPAYIIDLTTSENKTKYMAFLAIAATIGMGLGQLLGGIIGLNGWQYAVALQSVGLIVFGLIIWAILPESPGWKPATVKKKLFHFDIFSGSRVIKIFSIIVIIEVIGAVAYSTSIGMFLQSIGFSTAMIGLYMALAAIMGSLGNFILVNKIGKKIGEVQTFIIILFSSSILMLFAIVISSYSPVLAFMILLTFVFFSLTNRTFYRIIGTNLSKDGNGNIMGQLTSMGGIGNVIGAFVGGLLFAFNIYAPFILSSSLFGLSALILLINRDKFINIK